MLSYLRHSRFRRWKRLTCTFVGLTLNWFVVKYSDSPSRAEVSVSSLSVKPMLCVVTARASVNGMMMDNMREALMGRLVKSQM